MCISGSGHEFEMELEWNVKGVEGGSGRDGNYVNIELMYKILKVIKKLNCLKMN